MNGDNNQDFKSFYNQNRDTVKVKLEQAIREKQFKEMMKEGRTSIIVDWGKVIYGTFSLLFALKGFSLLYRE